MTYSIPVRKTSSGQTIVISALVIVVVVGVLGLVMDFGRAFLTTQQIQTKVDAAALAGAQGLPTASTAKTYATNCYNAQVSGGSVASATPGTSPCDGVNTGNANTSFYNIDGDCVAVTTPYSDTYTNSLGYSSTSLIKVRAYTSFYYMVGALFGLSTKRIYATSITLQKSTNSTPSGIQTLATSGTGLTLSSNTTVTVAGGVQVNSSAGNALTDNSTSSMSAQSIKVVGGVSGTGTLTPAAQTGAASVSDPLASLPAPAVPGTSYGGFSMSSGTQTINPGNYTGDINVSGGTLIMNPGIYYFNGHQLNLTGSGAIQGNGVFIFTTGSGKFNLTNTSGSDVNLSPMTSGTYAGILYFQDRTDTQNMHISGTSLTGSVSGILYAPAAQIQINLSATGTLTNTQLISNTLNINTNSNSLNITGSTTATGGGGGGGTQEAMLVE